MRSLSVCLVLLVTGSIARAEDAAEEAGRPPPRLEVGTFGGVFIPSSQHQFYELSLFPQLSGPMSREELRTVSPLAGLRLAYFITPWFGVEGEGRAIATATKTSHGAAMIYGGRLQLVFQASSLSRVFVPFVAIGDGFDRVVSRSAVLGSDTDWAPHVSIGAKLFVVGSIALRVDGRLLRAPSLDAPYHVNTNHFEFMLGVSNRLGRMPAEPPRPPPPPPIDTDGDGVFDHADRCPAEPEDKDLFDDTDGCPDPDNDADGVADAADQCPLDAEDKDGYQDEDGCNDKDNDGDGIADAQDKCANEPEDRDSFDDGDGCPDPDNDRDGFSDAQDKCPSEPEVINGVDDDDGCPDRGNALVVVMPDRLETLESITFKKAAIQKSSLNLMSQIGATMRAHPEIARLRITVHVQPTKKPDADLRLSEQRAFAVREWLIKYGIDEKRLEPRGFGSTNPLVDPKTKNAAAINDRVDLIILEKN